MNPSIFSILNASSPVKLILGANPLRVYPWGRAPEKPILPYAVYTVYNANPENYLDKVPDIDNKGTQIDIYAQSGQTLESAFVSVRDALEPYAHMISFATPVQDADTNFYSCRMEFDFWDAR